MKTNGRDVYGIRRNSSIEEAIDTYHLFTAIAERLEREVREGSQANAEATPYS